MLLLMMLLPCHAGGKSEGWLWLWLCHEVFWAGGLGLVFKELFTIPCLSLEAG